MPKKQANFRLRPQTFERIRQMAKAEGITQAEVIERAIEADGSGGSANSSPPGAAAAVSPEVQRIEVEADALDETQKLAALMRRRKWGLE